MAAPIVRNKQYEVKDNEICSLCNENLKTPRLLPCLHSFCTPCLDMYITEQETTNLRCPTCDLDVVLPKDGVKSLPENYLATILRLKINSTNATRNCLYCRAQGKTKMAEFQCLDCEDTLCNQCKAIHNIAALTAHHRLVPVEDFQSEKSNKSLICKQHSEGTRQLPLKYYCTECETLHCEECMLHEEKKLYGKDIWKVLYDEKLQSLTKEVEVLLGIIKEQKDVMRIIQKVEKSIHDKRADVENQIYDKALKIHELVDRIKMKKLTQVKETFDTELQKCKMLKNKERNRVKRFESMIIFVQTFIEHSTEGEYLMHEKDVKTKMADLMVERKKFEMMTEYLILEENSVDDIERLLNDAFSRLETRDIIMKSTAERGADVKPVIKGKMKLNIEAFGVAVGDDGDIIAVGGSKIEILSKHGKTKKVIYCEELKKAWSVVLRNDLIFVTDVECESKQLLVFDLDGHVRTVIRMPESEQCYGSWTHVSVAVSDGGAIYVCTEKTSAIYTCTLDNTELKLFISKEQQPDLKVPHYLSVTSSGHLVVSMYKNIKVYDETAKLLWQVDCKDGLNPYGLCCDMDDFIYIIISNFFSSNKIGVVKDGDLKGKFEIPGVKRIKGLAFNKDGELLVTHGTNEITQVSVWG